jgi:DNA anti-recombination protein RmuC
LQQVDDDLEQLIGTRTRAITRNLRAVEQMDEHNTNIVLDALPDAELDEADTAEE